MPIYLVRWEIGGYMPVEAETPEAALEIASDEWDDEIRHVSSHDVSFGSPLAVKSMQEAVYYDATLEGGDFTVYGSDKALGKLLPSDPNWTNPLFRRLKNLTQPDKSR